MSPAVDNAVYYSMYRTVWVVLTPNTYAAESSCIKQKRAKTNTCTLSQLRTSQKFIIQITEVSIVSKTTAVFLSEIQSGRSEAFKQKTTAESM